MFHFDDMLSAKDILNTFLGVIAGWAITHVYFMKGKPVERMTQKIEVLADSMYDNLRAALVYARFPDFFESPKARELRVRDLGSDLDEPQLQRVIVDHTEIKPGTKVEVLFKVVDEGWNFKNPDGAEVRDPHNVRLFVSNVGFGFMRTSFTVPNTDAAGRYSITFTLRDEGIGTSPPKTSTQAVDFHVVA